MRRRASSKRVMSPFDRELIEAKTLYEQAKDYHDKGEYRNAAEHFRQVLDIQESALGKYHFETIKSYWRYGQSLCLSKDKNDNDTLQAFQRALRMAESTFQDRRTYDRLWKEVEACWLETHPRDRESTSSASSSCPPLSTRPMKQVAQILDLEKQADAASKKRKAPDAILFYQQALVQQEALLGSDSLDGADIRCKMSILLIRQGDLTHAEKELQKAHDCYVSRLGDQHPATLGCKASMRNATKRLERKETSFKRKRWFNASLSSLGGSKKSVRA